MIDYVFKKDIEKEIKNNKLKIFSDYPISSVKGLALSDDSILINLSALQWKLVNEEILINEIGKTVVHETTHLILNDLGVPIESQENVCRILASQNEG